MWVHRPQPIPNRSPGIEEIGLNKTSTGLPSAYNLCRPFDGGEGSNAGKVNVSTYVA